MAETGWRWALLLITVLALLAGMPSGTDSATAAKDQIVIGLSQEPATLMPGMDSSTVGLEVQQAVFVDGVRWDDHWKLVPMHAREVPTLENELWKLLPGGKMQLTWHLKPLKWQDGVPVTAEDFVFSHRAIMNNRVPVIERTTDSKIESVYAPSPDTVVVTYKEPYARANIGIIGNAPWPRHLLEQAYRANPGGLDKLPYGNDPMATIGDGPFRITSWQKGSSIVAEANPDYTLDPPKIKRIIWRIFPNTNALVANMLSGAVDALSANGFTLDAGLQLSQEIAQRHLAMRVIIKPALIWEHVEVNLDNPKLKDKRIRQALLYAVDRQAMVDNLFQGKQPVAHSYLPPGHYGYTGAVRHYGYDPARAKQLLAEAGWLPGADGILRDAQGNPFVVTIKTTGGRREREAVEEILQAQWRKVGVDLRISNQPARVFFGEVLRHRDFDLGLNAFLWNPVSTCDGTFTSDNIPSPQNAYNGMNRPGFANEEMDRVCHGAPTELNLAKRVALLHRSQEILAEELPALPLYFRVDVTAVKAGLDNWKPTGTSDSQITWNASEWRWLP